jgi:hypothetical protein
MAAHPGNFLTVGPSAYSNGAILDGCPSRKFSDCEDCWPTATALSQMAAHPGNYSDCEACSLQQLSYPRWLPIQEIILTVRPAAYSNWAIPDGCPSRKLFWLLGLLAYSNWAIPDGCPSRKFSDCEDCCLQQLSYPRWLPIQEIILTVRPAAYSNWAIPDGCPSRKFSDCEACSLQQLSYPRWLPIQEIFWLWGLLPTATELSQMAANPGNFLPVKTASYSNWAIPDGCPSRKFSDCEDCLPYSNRDILGSCHARNFLTVRTSWPTATELS